MAIAGVLVADTVGWYVQLAVRGLFLFPQSVPLELCDASLLLIVVEFFTLSELIYDVVYFTALAGAAMALLTPNVSESFASISTVQSFFAHGLVEVATLFLLWSGQARPRPWSIARAMVFVNCWATIAGIFDWIFNANFMYMRHKPEGASLLDFFGPWPWYLLVTEAVALVLFVLLYLPFRLAAP
jgi:hypothetical integral membrane protein (TIGR02206 family)